MSKIIVCIDGMEENGMPAPVFTTEKLSASGTVRTVPSGATADSLGCILRLLNTPQSEIPEGRAGIEALAAGLTVPPEDAIFRGTLCTYDTLQQTFGPPIQDAQVILSKLLPKLSEIFPKWKFHLLEDYRCMIQIPGAAKQLSLVKTQLPHQHFGALLQDCMPQGELLGNTLAHCIKQSILLTEGKAVLLPWGQGTRSRLTQLQDRIGVRAAMVCQAEIVRGIARALGLVCPQIKGATADIDTDLHAKCRMTQALAHDYALVFVHVNGCDEAAHRRDSAQKAAFLKRICQQLLQPLLDGISPEDSLLLCSDHRTSSISGAHESEPVHFWLYSREKSSYYEFEKAGGPIQLLLSRGRGQA